MGNADTRKRKVKIDPDIRFRKRDTFFLRNLKSTSKKDRKRRHKETKSGNRPRHKILDIAPNGKPGGETTNNPGKLVAS